MTRIGGRSVSMQAEGRITVLVTIYRRLTSTWYESAGSGDDTQPGNRFLIHSPTRDRGLMPFVPGP